MSYRDHKIDVTESRDECGWYYTAWINGTPAALYCPTPENAVAIAKMIIEGE